MQAERAARTVIEKEGAEPARPTEERRRTVDEVADELQDRLFLEGARLSYPQNCESMQRIHISPAFGKRRVETIENRGHRASREGGAPQLSDTQDGPQRHYVPRFRLRARREEALGGGQSGR